MLGRIARAHRIRTRIPAAGHRRPGGCPESKPDSHGGLRATHRQSSVGGRTGRRVADGVNDRSADSPGILSKQRMAAAAVRAISRAKCPTRLIMRTATIRTTASIGTGCRSTLKGRAHVLPRSSTRWAVPSSAGWPAGCMISASTRKSSRNGLRVARGSIIPPPAQRWQLTGTGGNSARCWGSASPDITLVSPTV